MINKIFSLVLLCILATNLAFADVKKVAIVDVQKVVNKSTQVQNLKKDQESKRKEIAQLVKKAGEDIQKQTDETKKKALAKQYDKQIKAKQEAYAKDYKTKLENIDKSINFIITQQAKAMGYDLVLTKGVVLYGGDDITASILKVIK